jgi:hypothetical protein
MTILSWDSYHFNSVHDMVVFMCIYTVISPYNHNHHQPTIIFGIYPHTFDGLNILKLQERIVTIHSHIRFLPPSTL